MSDTLKTAKIIKRWYHSPSHYLTVNVLLNNITFLWFLLFSMCPLSLELPFEPWYHWLATSSPWVFGPSHWKSFGVKRWGKIGERVIEFWLTRTCSFWVLKRLDTISSKSVGCYFMLRETEIIPSLLQQWWQKEKYNHRGVRPSVTFCSFI